MDRSLWCYRIWLMNRTIRLICLSCTPSIKHLVPGNISCHFWNKHLTQLWYQYQQMNLRCRIHCKRLEWGTTSNPFLPISYLFRKSSFYHKSCFLLLACFRLYFLSILSGCLRYFYHSRSHSCKCMQNPQSFSLQGMPFFWFWFQILSLGNLRLYLFCKD